MALIGTAVALYLVLVSLLCGSFINLAADRLPRGESLLRPRSHCRSCHRQLNLVDLLPIAGYALRGGRCASCAAPIGVGAPFVETVAGVCMLAPVVTMGVWPGVAIGLVLLVAWGVLVTRRAARRLANAEAG